MNSVWWKNSYTFSDNQITNFDEKRKPFLNEKKKKKEFK